MSRGELRGSLIYSSIAQLVEHSAVNRRVVGSSPTGGAIIGTNPMQQKRLETKPFFVAFRTLFFFDFFFFILVYSNFYIFKAVKWRIHYTFLSTVRIHYRRCARKAFSFLNYSRIFEKILKKFLQIACQFIYFMILYICYTMNCIRFTSCKKTRKLCLSYLMQCVKCVATSKHSRVFLVRGCITRPRIFYAKN